jgi:hypothetical protein
VFINAVIPSRPRRIVVAGSAGDAIYVARYLLPGAHSRVGVPGGSRLLRAAPDLAASDGAPGDHFGFSVARSGDTAVVGAPDAHGGAGAAYVFIMRLPGHWTQEAELTVPGLRAGDHLGSSVAVFGDTAVVGAPSPRVWGGSATCSGGRG